MQLSSDRRRKGRVPTVLVLSLMTIAHAIRSSAPHPYRGVSGGIAQEEEQHASSVCMRRLGRFVAGVRGPPSAARGSQTPESRVHLIAAYALCAWMLSS